MAFAMVVLLAGVVLPGCASRKTLQALEGTTVTDLPPVPIDLGKETECATSRFSTRCAAVPSGTNNCVSLLRGESEMQLSKLLGETIEKEVAGKGRRIAKGSDQAKGSVDEDSTLSWNYKSTISGNMNFRRHESPLFKLDGGQEYAMRVCVVMEEAYYQIYTDMAENARRTEHPGLQQVFLDLREERYGDNPPDHDKVEDIQVQIAQHFQALWKMTSKQ
jgi:hypothetical protein